MAQYGISPRLTVSGYAWVNKPDTKFKELGLYHLKAGGPESDPQIAALMRNLDAMAAEALAEKKDKLPPKDKSKWNVYVPYERELDENGVETGFVAFSFAQNAKITLKDKTIKDIEIEIRDSKDNIVDAMVSDGAEVRIMFSPRVIEVASSKLIGPRLDFAKVQVLKLGKSGGAQGFGAVDEEGGFEGSQRKSNEHPAESQADDGEMGDY
jgi:hypothetical protein